MTTGPEGGYGSPYGSEPDGYGSNAQGSSYQNPQYSNPTPQQPYSAPQQQPYTAPQQPYATPQQQPYGATQQPYYNAQAPAAPYGGYGAAPYAVAPPSLTATVLVTIFFGLFGLIPAAIHSQRANEMGQDGSRYWKAFGITIGIEIGVTILLYVLIFALAAASYTSY
ncbi:MAG: hypothetical protein K4304_01615 [Propionicimonas sp.]